MSKKFTAQVLVPYIIIACCVYLWLPLEELPLPRFEPMGPALFPKILLGGIIALTVLDMILSRFEDRREEALRRKNAESREQGSASGPELEETSGMSVPVFAVAGFVIYLLLISYTDISYILLTFVFVALESWYLGHFTKRALLLSVCTAVVVSGLIYGIFGVILETFFP